MMHELERLRRFFESVGREIKLATTGQGEIDLYSPTGVMMAQIKTAVSEHEIAMMKVRQRRAAKQKAEHGKPQWKKAFGYLPDTRSKEDDDGTREPDPKTSKLVKKAYQAILTGASLKDICRLFNNANAFGLTGRPWTESTVSLFLRAPRNAGLRSHNGEIVGNGTWTPLVDVQTWKAVQAKINAPGRKPGKKSVQQHLLTRMLQCGKDGCGGYLSGQWVMQKTGGKPGRRKAGQKKQPHPGRMAHSITYACKTCHGVSIRAEHIEPILYKLVGGRLAQPDAVDLLRAEIHDEAQAEAIRAELAVLYADLKNVGVERGMRLLTGEQAKIATDYINERIAELESRQEDQDMLRVLDGIPLGKPEAVNAVKALTPDRFRSVLAVLGTITVAPVGKGSHVFDRRRVTVDWR
jgi:hypothetical protein